MRHFVVVLSTIFLFACNSNKTSDKKLEVKSTVPAAPTSVSAAEQLINAKHFVTVKAGLTALDTSYDWVNDKDTSEFAKEFLDKEMSFELYFNHDSTGILVYGKLPSFDSAGNSIHVPDMANMIYRVAEEKPAIFVQITQEKRSSFDGSIEKLVSAYRIIGADDKHLLLEAPRSYLDKAVVVLMEMKADAN